VASGRLPPHHELNALTRAVEALRAAGTPIVDLTETNPTRVGLPYPPDLVDALAQHAALTYEPHPRGLPTARQAIAADHRRRGVLVDPEHVVLAASTSEAYTWLFKLLCDPGDSVLVPRPSYPLFEHLTALEGVRAVPYDLDYHGRWEIDVASLRDREPNAKAVLVVSPNNPTGSYMAPAEFDAVLEACRRHGRALVVDEVFADYPLDAAAPLTDIATRSDVLTFTLAGLSKTAGLPQMKLAWIVAGGPAGVRDAALAALELIADTFLSVATPVQLAAGVLLERGGVIRDAIRARIAGNLATVRAAAARFPASEVLPVEGGWSAVVRVPSTRGEEALVLQLLEREHVLVHPGYFFDFPRETYIVISLLPAPAVFGDGVARALHFCHS
jgi:aspartate/methionine/tyrosine aminotransferase